MFVLIDPASDCKRCTAKQLAREADLALLRGDRERCVDLINQVYSFLDDIKRFQRSAPVNHPDSTARYP